MRPTFESGNQADRRQPEVNTGSFDAVFENEIMPIQSMSTVIRRPSMTGTPKDHQSPDSDWSQGDDAFTDAPTGRIPSTPPRPPRNGKKDRTGFKMPGGKKGWAVLAGVAILGGGFYIYKSNEGNLNEAEALELNVISKQMRGGTTCLGKNIILKSSVNLRDQPSMVKGNPIPIIGDTVNVLAGDNIAKEIGGDEEIFVAQPNQYKDSNGITWLSFEMTKRPDPSDPGNRAGDVNLNLIANKRVWVNFTSLQVQQAQMEKNGEKKSLYEITPILGQDSKTESVACPMNNAGVFIVGKQAVAVGRTAPEGISRDILERTKVPGIK